MKMFSRIMMVFMLMNTILLFAAEQENNDKKIWVDEETGMEINLQHPPMYRLITSTESGGLALLKRCILNGINVNHYDSRGGGNKSLLYLLMKLRIQFLNNNLRSFLVTFPIAFFGTSSIIFQIFGIL